MKFRVDHVVSSVDPLMWKNPMTASDFTTKGGMQNRTPKKLLHLLDVVGCWGYQNGLSNGIPEARSRRDLFLRRCYCIRPALCSAAGAAGAPASGRRFGDWSGETSWVW